MRYARHIIIFVITIGITFMFGCRANSDNHAVLAWVNDEPVTLGEFKVYFSRHRSDVFSFIADKYQVSDSESFWTHRYKDGEVPIELAKKATLDELAKVKLEQIYMKQNNICSDISYSNFLIKLKNENADRQKKIKDGQAIYGPKQYREVDYYKYIQNINVIKLKEYLGHYAFDTSQENLKKEYEIMKANYIEFKNGDTIKVKVIFVPWKE